MSRKNPRRRASSTSAARCIFASSSPLHRCRAPGAMLCEFGLHVAPWLSLQVLPCRGFNPGPNRPGGHCAAPSFLREQPHPSPPPTSAPLLSALHAFAWIPQDLHDQGHRRKVDCTAGTATRRCTSRERPGIRATSKTPGSHPRTPPAATAYKAEGPLHQRAFCGLSCVLVFSRWSRKPAHPGSRRTHAVRCQHPLAGCTQIDDAR